MSEGNVPVFEEELNQTKLIPFVWGHFGLNEWKIPYLSLTMELKDAARFLTLASDLPGEKNRDFNIEELFQRDIDWDRVHRSIAPWLLDDKNPQFFSALTVVLLPYSQRDKAIVYADIESYSWKAPKLGTQFSEIRKIGPAAVGFYNTFEQLGDPNSLQGRISWNTDQAFAVAIDGQHRLAAIKMIADKYQNDMYKSMRVPVNLLVFDPRLGFVSPEGTEFNSLELMRRIFIDVNKHAATVKRARQLLLDDVSPQALFLRSLIQNKLTNTVATEVKSLEKLPLSLVDWHREDAKFDFGPYFTSVLSLDSHVSTLIGQSAPEKSTDWKALKKYIETLAYELGVDTETSEANRVLAENAGKPFTFSPSELKQMKANFSAIWLPAVREVLYGLNPYVELLEVRSAHDSFSLDWQTWYRLKYAKDTSKDAEPAELDYRQFKNELQEREAGALMEHDLLNSLSEIEKCKKESQLAYAVVFQKALFRVLREITNGQNKDTIAAFVLDDSLVLEAKNSQDYVGDLDEEDGEENYIKAIALQLGEVSEEYLDDEDQYLPSEDAKKFGAIYESIAEDFVARLNDIESNWASFYQLDTQGPSKIAGSAFRWWDGSLYRGGTINFSDSAAKRAAELVESIYVMSLVKEFLEYTSFEDLIDAVEDAVQNDDPLIRNLQRLFKRQSGSSGIGRILVTQENLNWEPANYDRAKDEVRKRWQIAWNCLA